MKTRLGVLVLLGTVLTSAGIAARGDGKDVKAELKRFQGTWAVASSQKGGKPVGMLKNGRLTFAGDRITLRQGDQETFEGAFQIDPSKKPRHIDLMFNGEKAVPGIYASEGGKLKLCLNPDGERPTEFRSPEGSNTLLLVLKRAKK